MVRICLFVLLLVSQFAVASFAVARNPPNLSREQIRSMHILDRPSRPGHFYGNAVRRRYQRGVERGAVPSNSAMIWQNQGPGIHDGQSYPLGEVIISE